METKWEKHKREVTIYNAMKEVLVDCIARAADFPNIRELHDEYSRWDDCTVREMLDNLVVKKSLTSNMKTRMHDEIFIEWDQDKDLHA